MKTHTTNQVITAIQSAQIAADVHRESADDGSCNMDTVLMRLPQWTKKDIEEVAAACNVRFGDVHTSGLYKGYRFLFIQYSGQAARRTRMMEAAYKSLDAADMDVSMWYHLD